MSSNEARVYNFPTVPPVATEGGGLGGESEFPPPEINIEKQPNGREAKRDEKGVLRYTDTGNAVNVVWDACVIALGYEPRTISEKKLWGKMVPSLQGAGADHERIAAVAKWYRRHWPGIDLTITALEKWYSHFLRLHEEKANPAFKCSNPSCGLSFKTQDKLEDHMRNVHDE